MLISFVVAVTENNVIGKNNDLPWSLPDDMKFFVKTTRDHHILMGRKNLESFGKLLPKRTNIVITTKKDYQFEDAVIKHSIEEGIEYARTKGEKELMIIGGGDIYRQTLPIADRIYLTRIHTTLEGDTFFPELNAEEWKEVSSEYHPKDERHPFDFTFKVLERLK